MQTRHARNIFYPTTFDFPSLKGNLSDLNVFELIVSDKMFF